MALMFSLKRVKSQPEFVREVIYEEFYMIYFMKPLPEGKIDTTDWKPFIKNIQKDHRHYFLQNGFSLE